MKSERRNYILMPLPLNAPKYLASKAKPDNNKFIKNQRIRFILKKNNVKITLYFIVNFLQGLTV